MNISQIRFFPWVPQTGTGPVGIYFTDSVVVGIYFALGQLHPNNGFICTEHNTVTVFNCKMVEEESYIACRKLNILRCILTSVSPKIVKGVENMKYIHSVYLDLYVNAEALICPSKLKSELVFHISHHFAMILILIDEIYFLQDGRILRPYQENIASCGDFVHPTKTDSFFSEDVDVKFLKIPLCVRSISGYLYEENSLLKLVSKLILNNHEYEVAHS